MWSEFVSSILKINFPPYFFTYNEVNPPVIAWPKCIGPDGDGANLIITPFLLST